MSGNLLAVEVVTVSTFANPGSPSVVVFDGHDFAVLRNGENVSGKLDADQAAEFVTNQVRSAIFTTDTTDTWLGGVL